MDNAFDYVENTPYTPAGGIIPGPGEDDLLLMWKTDSIKSYDCFGPNIEVTWGQYWPFNHFCPNYRCGCVPLAIAQAMTFTRSVSSLKLTYDGRDKENITFDWNDIVKHSKNTTGILPWQGEMAAHLGECGASNEAHFDLARLARQIGHDCRSIYGDSGTATPIGPSYNAALEKYFPSETLTYRAFDALVYGSLDRNSVALLTSYSDNHDDNEGMYDCHTFIADGQAIVFRMTIIYYEYNPKTGEYKDKTCHVKQEDEYFHINWGWNGEYDGFYLINLLQPGSCVDWVYPETPRPDNDPGQPCYSNSVHAVIIRR